MLAILAAAALQTVCPQFFAGGVAPDAPEAIQLCADGFSVGYRKDWGEPAWSAQVETPASIAAAAKTSRNGTFKPCELPDGTKSVSPRAYAKSGFDLGHMSESAASADKSATFTTCNSVPQRPELNRLEWAGVEQSLRNLAASGETLYIVTGPQIAQDAPRLAGTVSVPSATFKAVYDVGRGAEAWTCTNTAAPVCAQEDIPTLEAQIGFAVFPGIGLEPAITLPEPTKGAD